MNTVTSRTMGQKGALTFPNASIFNVLSHAIGSVPYYRRRLSYITDFNDISYQDFLAVPHLTKRDLQIQNTPYEFFSESIPRDRLIFEKTSGSTGTPMLCAKSPADRLRASWATWSVRRWWTPLERGSQAAAVGLTWRGLTHTHQGDLRLSVNDVTDRTISYYCRRLAGFRPKWMYGFPSMIHRIASYLESHRRIRVPDTLSLIELQGEYLPPGFRKTIEDIFRCPVSDQYGCTEIWVIAYSCPAGSMHILENDVYVEILDSDGKPVPVGKVGQVVITSLRMEAMPFIRYELGDTARILPNACSCGRNLLRLELTGCRQSQTFKSIYGKQFDGAFFVQTLEHASTSAPLCRVLQNYQVVLRAPRVMRLYYQPGPRFAEHGRRLLSEFENRIHSRIDSRMAIEFRRGFGIRRAGKFNIFFSDIGDSRFLAGKP